MPASVIRLMVWCVAPRATPTMATVTGMAADATSVLRHRRRKAKRTPAASNTPIRMAYSVPTTESETKRAWS